jgi:hypothetical protein
VYIAELDQAVTPVVVRRYRAEAATYCVRGCDGTEVLCAVSRLVVVRPVASRGCSSAVRLQQARGAASVCVTKRWITRWLQHVLWRSPGQAQAGAPAVSSTVGSTVISAMSNQQVCSH